MIIEAIKAVFSLDALLIIVIGSIIAMITGALPGLGPSITIALAIPITFSMEADKALMLMGSIYTSCIYGGGITAILLGIPGTTGSAASCLDGYEMSEQGKAGTALGISLAGSTIGALIGVVLLILTSSLLIKIVLLFGPAEYFWVTALGLTIVITISKGNFLKGMIACIVGLLLSTVGMNSITGEYRYVFNTKFLYDGLSMIPVLLAFFSISQMINLVESKRSTISVSGKITGNVYEGLLVPIKYFWSTIQSALIGFLIGAMPGIGMSVANWVAYAAVKQRSAHPETFGKGDPEGLLAPETANNATVGGSLVPTLVLGIPGSETTAVLLGAMLVHGVTPGLNLFKGAGTSTLYSFFVSLIVSSVLMLILGFIGMRYVAKVTIVPISLLVPLIIIFTFIGAFAMNSAIGDMYVVSILGILAYGMKKFGYPIVAAALGFILGPLLEKYFNLTLIICRGTIAGLAESPLAKILIVLTLLFLGFGFYSLLPGKKILKT